MVIVPELAADQALGISTLDTLALCLVCTIQFDINLPYPICHSSLLQRNVQFFILDCLPAVKIIADARDTSKSALNGSITRDFLQRTCPEISNRKTQITDNIQTTNPNSLTFQCITACSAL